MAPFGSDTGCLSYFRNASLDLTRADVPKPAPKKNRVPKRRPSLVVVGDPRRDLFDTPPKKRRQLSRRGLSGRSILPSNLKFRGHGKFRPHHLRLPPPFSVYEVITRELFSISVFVVPSSTSVESHLIERHNKKNRGWDYSSKPHMPAWVNK